MITVRAADLHSMLTILDHTSITRGEDTPYRLLFLYTKDTAFGESVGTTTYLFGMTSKMTSAGYTGIPASGSLHKAWCLPPSARAELKTVLKSWLKQDVDAEIELRVSEHGAGSVTLQGSSDHRLNFMLVDGESFPSDEVAAFLAGTSAEVTKVDKDGRELPDGKRLRLSDVHLATAAKIAKFNGGTLDLLPVAHKTSVILAESGDWRGAFMAEEYLSTADVDEVEVDLELPEPVEPPASGEGE